jgi:hypothetical protein
MIYWTTARMSMAKRRTMIVAEWSIQRQRRGEQAH